MFFSIVLTTIGIAAYLVGGLFFAATFGWCIGMPASSCHTVKQKVTKFALEWSMVFFYPFWIIFMVVVLVAGR